MKIVHILVVFCLVVGGCAGAPKSLGTVTGEVPERVASYPADAVSVAKAVAKRIQGEDVPGVDFSPGAAMSLARHGFRYPEFAMWAHRLLRYDETDKDGRLAVGSMMLKGPLGRVAAILYDARYRLWDGRLVVDEVSALPLYRKATKVRAFLVPKEELPELAESWEESYRAMAALNAMPEDGLRTPHLLGTHALVLFVMERMHPDTDLRLDVPIEEVHVALNTVRLSQDGYRDYNGWRVAVVEVSPGLHASR